MAKAGMFANAKSVAKPKEEKGKPKKQEITIEHLEDYARIDALITNLESIRDTIRSTINTDAWAIFKDKKNIKRPENFRGVDGMAEASVELRKRSSRSPLRDEEVVEFLKHSIPFAVVEERAETFVINPAYATSVALIAKVEKALVGIKGLPDDFIQKQDGIKKNIVTDSSIDFVFEKKKAEEFLESVCVLAIKPTLKQTDLKKALALADKYIDSEKQKTAADASKTLAANLLESLKGA